MAAKNSYLVLSNINSDDDSYGVIAECDSESDAINTINECLETEIDFTDLNDDTFQIWKATPVPISFTPKYTKKG